MKKIPLIFLFIIVLGLFIFGFALGADDGGLVNPLRYAEIDKIIVAFADLIFDLALVVAPILVLIAGFLFVTAAGNPERIKKARDILMYTAIGLFVVIFARGLVAMLEGIIGVEPPP